jgi:hypothetical protein
MNSSRYFVFPVVLFVGTVLEAQPKVEVAIDAVVIQVDTGYKQSLRVSTADGAGLFSALLTDPRAQVLSRSRLHISDGSKGQLELGSVQVGRGSATARPTISIEMTPEVQNMEELVLHIRLVFRREMQYVLPDGRSQPIIAQRRRTANIRLREGQMDVLDGSSVDPGTDKGVPDLSLLGTPSEELMISFTPHIVLSN